MEAKIKTEIKYFVFYKPYNVLNQFTKEQPQHVTLADYLKVEKDVYPLGRLDKDSEGLLILTNDRSLNALLLSPAQHHKRSYFVQVENDLTEQAISKISKGVEIKLDTGDYKTRSCTVKKLPKPPTLPDRNPPIRVRQNIPTSWALIELTEGKNRQVRKMFATVGFPVLRLVRVQIEDLKLGKLEPGKYYEIKADELFKLIKVDPSALSKPKPSGKRVYPNAKTSKSIEKSSLVSLKDGKKVASKPIDKPKFESKGSPKPKNSEKTKDKREFEGSKKEVKSFKPKSTSSKPKPFSKKDADKNKKSYFKR